MSSLASGSASTESVQWAHEPIDALAPQVAISAMIASHVDAAQSTLGASAAITAAAKATSNTIREGGTLVYCGAGSSGLMGLADALELPGTFGIARDCIRILLAEGIDTITRFQAESEDSTKSAIRDFSNQPTGSADSFILLSASGSTPYVLEMARLAGEAGATTIAIVSNPNTPLAAQCDITIVCGEGPETVAGSTRLGAATAQKIALNCISTLAGVMLGHVYHGRMVNLVAANSKLASRAQRIVMDVAEVTEQHASAKIQEADGDVKLAIMLASGARDIDHARSQLKSAEGHLGEALEKICGPTGGNSPDQSGHRH